MSKYLIIIQESIKLGGGRLITFVIRDTEEEAMDYCKAHNTELCRVYSVAQGAIAGQNGTFSLKEL